MPLRSKIEFASAAQYAVRSADPALRDQSIRFRDAIKRGQTELFARIARYLTTRAEADEVRRIFGDEVVLVPAPGSAPHSPGALWVPERICQAFVAAGLAQRTEAWLTRTSSVPKSAFAAPDARPDANMHYSTIRAERHLESPARIVVVDDVVTRGCTLLAAVSRLAEVYRTSTIVGFAVTRAISHGEIDRIPAPVCGVIELQPDGTTQRIP